MRAFVLVGLLPQPKIKDFRPGTPTFLALRAEALTALRHRGRTFTVHAAESAGVPKGLYPLTPAGALPLHPARGIMPLDLLL